MCMLSSKCDGLRKTADELQAFIDNAHNYTWSGLFSTLHLAQQGLRSAADTILELRNKLAGVVDQQDEIERLQSENANLRELVSLYHYGATHEASPSDTLAWSCKVDSLRRELGIWVE